MWYAVWKNQKGRVMGFITEDEDELPQAWETEEEAHEDMKGHMLYPHYTEFIEL